MMKIRFLLFAFLFVSIMSVGSAAKVFSDVQSRNINVSHVFPLNVVFLGFNEEVIDTSLIALNIQENHQFNYGNYTMNYNFNVSYYFANSSYYTALKTFILANSVNGTDTTSALNTTALQTQRTTGKKMSIFLPQSGRAINAAAVEEWFVANPYMAGLDPSYWFYIMNFTEFDSPDHALEHWYNTTELDFEADYMRDFWRLEWDNALNPNVKFPYACFTSQSRVFFIDPSAFQWYLTWARIWWGLSVSGPKYDYYYEDLDEFLATHDVGTSQGKANLAYYLAGWIDDALGNLLAPNLWTSIRISKAKSMSIQTLVLNNASDFGCTNEVMNWIINSTLAKEAITDLAPFIDVEVAVEFHNLSSYPQLEGIFDGAVIEKKDGWTYYDGYEVWSGLSSVRDSYFNFSAADIVINGYVFLEKNMSMIIYGEEYTGLGGGGQILVMKEVGRYFQEDGISPKSGLGLVFIHEAGHNLGFPHTFVHGIAYAGDFSFDVMGYYPYSYFFTLLRKDCFRRLVVDFMFLGLEEMLDEDSALYGRKTPNSTIDVKFDEINLRIDDALQLYDKLQYLEAYNKIIEAEELEPSLEDLVWMYLCDLNNDGAINLYDAVKLLIAYGSKPGDTNWNPNADLIQDDVINLYDAVILLSNYGRKWLPN